MTSTFDFMEFRRVAESLAAQGEEAELRSAVSRLYYALFHVARNRTGVFSSRDSHSKVVRAVRTKSKSVGDQLNSLKLLRQAADYDLVPQVPISPDWHKNWQRACMIASNAFPRLRTM